MTIVPVYNQVACELSQGEPKWLKRGLIQLELCMDSARKSNQNII